MYRKNEIRFIKCWDYHKKEKTKYDKLIEICEHMQMPYCYLFHISGEFNTKLCFLTDLGGIGKNVAYVDNDGFLYAGFADNVIKYDLKTNTLIKNVIDGEWVHNFFELDGGFLLHQEMTVKYFDKDLNLLWKDGSCVDIFANTKLDENYEIGKNYVAIIDWCGFKHFYNKNGRFKVVSTKYDSYH